MIIDCHGHFTTAPAALGEWRAKQLAALGDPVNAPRPSDLRIGDDEIREALETGQLQIMRERGGDLILFSPIASHMAHHAGDERTSRDWSMVCNDLVHRACEMYPANFAAVCQLPQSPGVAPLNCVAELRRCVEDLGFVACNLNPDPSGGSWRDPPLTDRFWYPLYEEMVRLDVPAMIHVSASCLPSVHTTGAHYIHGDTTAFMQLLSADLFADFPTLRFVIPHGGGAVPYHWGRYRGMALDQGREAEALLRNISFDTCVYHQNGIELLLKTVPIDNLLFGSEMLGAVRGRDPRTGEYFDDTKKYLDDCAFLGADELAQLFEGNARRVYPRLDRRLTALGL